MDNLHFEQFNFERNFVKYCSNYDWGIKDSNYYELSCVGGVVSIISKKPINEHSYSGFNCFYTDVSVTDFIDIVHEQLYAEYKGKKFVVSQVTVGFKKIRLDGTSISSEEALKYGFVYSRDYGQYYLDVDINDVILFSKKFSVYEQMKAKEKKNK